MANVGRAHAELLRWLADDFFDKKIPPGYTERIDAALREAAQQERKRIRAALASRNLDAVDKATVAAILAEPSDGPQYVEEVEDRYDR